MLRREGRVWKTQLNHCVVVALGHDHPHGKAAAPSGEHLRTTRTVSPRHTSDWAPRSPPFGRR